MQNIWWGIVVNGYMTKQAIPLGLSERQMLSWWETAEKPNHMVWLEKEPEQTSEL